MTVTVAVVMSVDGKLTRHQEAGMHGWASAEDQAHFSALIAKHEVIIMGSHTYTAARQAMRLELPVKRIVLTHQPHQFATQAIADQLEFRNQAASQLVRELQVDAVKSVLVVGGPQIITELLSHGLVDRLIVTLEPHLFGEGIPLLTGAPLDITLQLATCQKLNETGTLQLEYTVINN